MGARGSFHEDIRLRGGDVIRVVRWSNGKITIENAPVFLTVRQAEKIAAALVSCASYRAANGYSTKTPHPSAPTESRR